MRPTFQHVAAGVAAWCLPGLGHLLLGQTVRGMILGVVIGSVWVGGLWIGGLSVIDRRDQPAWFLGQMLLAPSWIVNQHHQRLRASWLLEAGSRPGLVPPYEPAFGKPLELGTLYTGLAGLLNLLCVIDAASGGTPGRERQAVAG